MRWALRQAMDLNYITRMANSLKWRVGHLTNMRDNGGGSLVISLGSLYSNTLCFWLCYFKTLAMARIRGKVVSMFKCLPGGICGRIQDSWQVYFLPGHKKNVKQSYRGRLERFQMKSCRMSSCIKVFIQEQTGFWSHWSAMVSPVLHSFFYCLCSQSVSSGFKAFTTSINANHSGISYQLSSSLPILNFILKLSTDSPAARCLQCFHKQAAFLTSCVL